ncbi:hypothetical protein CRV24_003817 [Beauveria bassiana]|nr:hypothetical protein CRV24_003817 [Beauveria bassiana]
MIRRNLDGQRICKTGAEDMTCHGLNGGQSFNHSVPLQCWMVGRPEDRASAAFEPGNLSPAIDLTAVMDRAGRESHLWRGFRAIIPHTGGVKVTLRSRLFAEKLTISYYTLFEMKLSDLFE